MSILRKLAGLEDENKNDALKAKINKIEHEVEQKAKKESRIKGAEILVDTMKMFAIGSFTTYNSVFSAMSKVSDLKQWDFFITVAGVFIALSVLRNENFTDEEKDKLNNITLKKLEEWDFDGLRAFDDCKILYETTYDELMLLPEYKRDQAFLAADSIGKWIVWNVFGQPLQDIEDIKLARAIGFSVIHVVYNWWK